jgi:hypothetical protein
MVDRRADSWAAQRSDIEGGTLGVDVRGLIGLAVIVVACGAHPLLAQPPPAESCGPGADLGPWDSLPWSGAISAAVKDFVMTGAGRVETDGTGRLSEVVGGQSPQ